MIIHSDADGVSVEMISGEELEKRLNEDGPGYWGAEGFMEEMGDEDPNYWDSGKLLVVKGDVFTPTPEKVVEKWKV